MPEPQHTALIAELEAHIARRDRTGAVRAVTAAVRDGRAELDDVFSRVLIPVLVSTGDQWAAGSKRIWEEHLTSSIVRTVVESLTVDVADAAARVTPVGRTVLLACPSGEQHDLGLRMLTNRLLLRGWDAHFLGADTPALEVVAAARAVSADLVVLSAATAYNLVILRAYVDEVKAGLPGVQVGVGGPAFACNHNWAAEDLLVLHELGIDDDPSGACELPGTEA
ncbi:MAG: cobalamin B12-binding domain-containing protein [Coriobacteriia bacterium]|nr:cobalamin B12-binding domain-containing protein [Coriobacteriia bacterium]